MSDDLFEIEDETRMSREAAAAKLQQAQAFADELRAIEDKGERLKRFAELKAEFCEDTGKETFPDGYIFLPGTMGVVPFDIPEAETELIEGPLLEYGGPLLALFQITSALKTFVVLGLGVALFFPGTISDIWLVNLVWFLLKCLGLMLVSLTLVKSATGRFRIDQAFRFYITVPTALALCSLILVWVM